MKIQIIPYPKPFKSVFRRKSGFKRLLLAESLKTLVFHTDSSSYCHIINMLFIVCSRNSQTVTDHHQHHDVTIEAADPSQRG